MTDTPAHTPLRLSAGDETRIMDSKGFPLIDVPCGGMTGRRVKDAEQIAAFIVRACNSHYQLVEALRASIDAIEDDRGLDDYICCSGYMCGCQGSSKRQLMLHDLRAALSQAGGASE